MPRSDALIEVVRTLFPSEVSEAILGAPRETWPFVEPDPVCLDHVVSVVRIYPGGGVDRRGPVTVTLHEPWNRLHTGDVDAFVAYMTAHGIAVVGKHWGPDGIPITRSGSSRMRRKKV